MDKTKGWIGHQEIVDRLHVSYHEALRMDRMGVHGAMNLAQDIYDAAMFIKEIKDFQDQDRKQLYGNF